jgi:hypothetical protein
VPIPVPQPQVELKDEAPETDALPGRLDIVWLDLAVTLESRRFRNKLSSREGISNPVTFLSETHRVPCRSHQDANIDSENQALR